jgi:hypothetical protein
MEKKKTKMEILADEYSAEEATPTKTPLKGSKATPEGVVTKKALGRPKTKPESRQISFHVPVDLIPKIEAEALIVSDGNKSSLLIKMIKYWFANKK